MGKISKGDVARGVSGILIGMVVLLCYGASAGLHGETLVDWRVPVSVVVFMALVSGIAFWRMWRWLTRSDNAILNYACHVIVACGVLSALFYGCNYAFSDKDSRHVVDVSVERLYSKTRYRQQRVSRRVYRQGAPYKVYFMEAGLPDGRLKELSLSQKQYRRLHVGDTLELPVERGLFGVAVMKRKGVNVEVPRSSHRLE